MNDLKQRLWGIPLVAVIITLVAIPWQGGWEPKRVFLNFVITLLVTAILWHTSRATVAHMRKRFPAYQQTLKRLLWQTLISQLLVIVLTLLACIALVGFFTGDWPRQEQVIPNLLVAVQVTFLISIIYEAVFFFQQWKTALVERESLQLEQLRSRYELLRQQISPHFLFNSLNTLAAIIPEDPKTAEQFVEKLAQVYRYVLRHTESETVPLQEELECVQAYVYLHQVRVGEHLQLQLEIAPDAGAQRVLPNALQLLVENAIKHNVATGQRPLHLLIRVDKTGLEVRNNLQPRQTAPESTHIGLHNLRERYRMLVGQEPEVIKDAHTFIVKLPVVI